MTNSSEPLYMQIYNQLREDILAGKYTSGNRLPTEKELCQIYHVSRITSKKALNMLVDDKLVVRIKGRGSYIVDGFINKNNESVLYHNKYHKPQTIGLVLIDFDESYGMGILASIEKCCRDNNTR